jgi:hypothetical protein
LFRYHIELNRLPELFCGMERRPAMTLRFIPWRVPRKLGPHARLSIPLGAYKPFSKMNASGPLK